MPSADERRAYREKLRSLAFAPTRTPSKTTTDDHGTHRVDVTERDSGQDVTVRLPTIRLPKGPPTHGEEQGHQRG